MPKKKPVTGGTGPAKVTRPKTSEGNQYDPHAESPVSGYTGIEPGHYASVYSGPRVGGAVTKSVTPPLAGGTKKQVKASKSMVRKGTGSGASKAAKASYKRLK